MKLRKKLIEVALPLEAINIASAREKSIRHGHPSTLRLSRVEFLDLLRARGIAYLDYSGADLQSVD